jgi:tetratricopeptide (TPR) repeat protein
MERTLTFSPDDDDYMAQGGTLLNAGHTLQAFFRFSHAALNDPTSCEAPQMMGVCMRMLGELELADSFFSIALAYATTNLQSGKIWRDWSMVAVVRGDYATARQKLEQSLRSFAYDEAKSTESSEQARESAVTYGFLGEVYRLCGDRQRGFLYTKLSYLQLRGVEPYELNSLMRHLLTTRWPRRPLLARRAWKLARRAKNTERKKQILVACISPKLRDRFARR